MCCVYTSLRFMVSRWSILQSLANKFLNRCYTWRPAKKRILSSSANRTYSFECILLHSLIYIYLYCLQHNVHNRKLVKISKMMVTAKITIRTPTSSELKYKLILFCSSINSIGVSET